MNNDYEQMVETVTDEFVTMVRTYLRVVAPAGPWWTERASPEAQTLRWMEIRSAAVDWMARLEQVARRLPFSPNDPLGTKYAKLFTDRDPSTIADLQFFATMPKEVRQAFRYGGIQHTEAWINRAERNAGPVARAMLRAMQRPAAPSSMPKGVLLGGPDAVSTGR